MTVLKINCRIKIMFLHTVYKVYFLHHVCSMFTDTETWWSGRRKSSWHTAFCFLSEVDISSVNSVAEITMSGPRVPGAGRHVKMSGVSVIITCQDETNVPGAGGSELTSEEYDQLVKMTKFTEFEIVTLWNHFKADFPCGNINQSQLSQMIKKTFPKYMPSQEFLKYDINICRKMLLLCTFLWRLYLNNLITAFGMYRCQNWGTLLLSTLVFVCRCLMFMNLDNLLLQVPTSRSGVLQSI